MVDAGSQEIASAPHDAVHRVHLFQKQFAQIGAILTGDPGNQRDFVAILHLSQIFRPKHGDTSLDARTKSYAVAGFLEASPELEFLLDRRKTKIDVAKLNTEFQGHP